jgi:formylglycine-generating enzyme required for sulfatase activity
MRTDRRLTLLPILLCLCVAASQAEAQTAPAHKPGEVYRDCPDCSEMVVVPSGEFDMGSADSPFETPQHHVSIAKPFAIGRREVTFAEWDLCVAGGGCKFTPRDHNWGRANRPVIEVSWDDAVEFVGWLSKKTGRPYRLPTEAEWEYAARAGGTSAYWWGKDVGADHARCDGCGGDPARQSAPAGSFRPNAFGLYDTAGNAAEWVQDCWNANYRGAPHDGSGWKTGDCTLHVLRGGSFADKPAAVRSAARFRYDEDVRYYANGFRVAADLK